MEKKEFTLKQNQQSKKKEKSAGLKTSREKLAKRKTPANLNLGY